MISLLAASFKILRNRVLALTIKDELKTAAVIFGLLLFLSAIFLGLSKLMLFLNSIPVAGPLMLDRLMSMIFLAAFSMAVFSSIVTSLNTLYYGDGIQWLMSKPLKPIKIFFLKAASSLLYSSWMPALMFLPLIFAFGMAKSGGKLFYINALACMPAFFIAAGFAGIIISLIIVYFFPRKKVKDLITLIGIILGTALYIFFRLLQPERLARMDGIEAVSQYLSFLRTPGASFLPSSWAASSFITGISSNMMETMRFTAISWLYAFLLVLIAAVLANSLYYDCLGMHETVSDLSKKDIL